MIGKWSNKTLEQRIFLTSVLNTAASNLPKFANAGDDPIGAVVAAVNIAAIFASMTGPKGMLVSTVLNFVSGFLSLFGKAGTKKKSVGQIVREQIDEALDEFYDRTLTAEASGAEQLLQVSKTFLDGIAQEGEPLGVNEAISLAAHVPVYNGIPFMGTLARNIEDLVKENKAKDAKKCLKYIELYCTIAILKEMTLQQYASVLPESFTATRRGINDVLVFLRHTQTLLLKFLYESDLGGKIMPYFDPDVRNVTDAYLGKYLGVPNYDRSLAGTYCFTPGGSKLSMTWLESYRGFTPEKPDRPFATLGTGSNCFWKVVPHGKSLFTIVNKKNYLADKYGGALLSWDRLEDGKARVTIEHQDPVLWEISGSQQKR